MEKGKLNPKVKKLEVGIREMRTINVWPLSIADQTDMGSVIVDAITDVLDVAASEGNTGSSTVDSVYSAVKNNLPAIAKIATGEEDILKEMDNEQFLELADIIYRQNFEVVVKKMPKLKETWGAVFAIRPKMTEVIPEVIPETIQ